MTSNARSFVIQDSRLQPDEVNLQNMEDSSVDEETVAVDLYINRKLVVMHKS